MIRKKLKKMSKTDLWMIIGFLIVLSVFLIHFLVFDLTVVSGSSMSPTIENGDLLVVNRIGYNLNNPDYNDIVTFCDNGVKYIKRIIGKEGDKISIENNIVYRNDEPIREEYISAENYPDFEEVVVPKDQYFVLGDNRTDSLDSRDKNLGFIDRSKIFGKAVFRYWPFKAFGAI